MGQWLTGGRGTNQSPWQSSRCSPQTCSGSLETSAGGRDRESGFCASSMPNLSGFTCLSVRRTAGPSQRATQRECCVLWNFFLDPSLMENIPVQAQLIEYLCEMDKDNTTFFSLVIC